MTDLKQELQTIKSALKNKDEQLQALLHISLYDKAKYLLFNRLPKITKP